MKLSERGIAFLKHIEGFSPCIYPDAGKWAIGYGCQVDDTVWRGLRMTENQAETLLRARLREYEAAVTESVKVPLEQHQADACCLLAYNVGAAVFRASTLAERLNDGKAQEAADQFLRWIYSQGKENDGLKARRALERRIFLGEPVKGY